MKELQIISKQMPSVTINFDEVKADLEAKLQEYKNLVVTEETLKDCKATQKEIAKIRKGIDSYRKTIKKELSAPIKEFEDKCKLLVGIVEEVEKPIKDGLNFYELKRKSEKAKKIDQMVVEIMESFNLPPKHKDKITIDKSFLNITAKDKAIRDAITTQCINLRAFLDRKDEDYKIILRHLETTNKAFNLSCELKIEDVSLPLNPDGSYNLQNIIDEITRLARKVKEAENKPVAEFDDGNGLAESVQGIIPTSSRVSFDLRVFGGEDILKQVEQLLMDNFIEYEVL